MAEQRGSLFVTIVDCCDLFVKSSGQSAYQEPFCVLKLGDLEVRTNTVAISAAATLLSPRWNQEFKLEADRSQVLKVQVLNKDVFQNDHFLGQIKLPILQLPPHSPEELNVKLKKSKGKGTGKGSLHLIVEWHPPVVNKEDPEDRKHKANQGGLGDAIARKLHLPKKAATGNNVPTASNKKVFGKPIDSQKADVPLVLKLTLNVIDSKGMNIEGVFRMSAPVSEVEALREQFESGKDVEWYSYDIHVVAGLLMSFLLTLPEPLMTFELYDSLVSTYETVQDVKSRKQLLRKLFSTLPPGNRVTMEAILQVLQRLSENSAVNKMDARNLGIVFGPAVLRRKEETPQQLIHDSPILIGLVSSMIEDVDFFTGRESKDSNTMAAIAASAAASAAAATPSFSTPITTSPASSTSASSPSPLSLSASAGSPSNSQSAGTPLSLSGNKYLADVHISDEQREKAISAATGALRDKPAAASPSKANWTMAGKSTAGGATKPVVPSAPLAAMRSERQPTPFTAALGSSSAQGTSPLLGAKDLKKTVPKAPLPHTPPIERRRIDDEGDADAPAEKERPLSGKHFDFTQSSSSSATTNSGKHNRRDSHGKKEKTSGKHHEKKERSSPHQSSSHSSPSAPALPQPPDRSAEVQNLLDTLDQASTQSSYQQQQLAASVQAAQGGPKVLKFDQARRSIQLSLDAISQLAEQPPPALVSPSASSAPAAKPSPLSAVSRPLSEPGPLYGEEPDKPPATSREPLPPADDLPPLSLPPALPPPALPSQTSPRLAPHAARPAIVLAPIPVPAPRVLPTLPAASAAPKAPVMKPVASLQPLAPDSNTSPARALPSVPAKQPMQPLAAVVPTALPSTSPRRSPVALTSDTPPLPLGNGKPKSSGASADPPRVLPQPPSPTSASVLAKTPTAAPASAAPVPPVSRTSTQTAAPSTKVHAALQQDQQSSRRLSNTKAPDPHAEQLTRIYNIMRDDIEKTREHISTLLRDLSDGRLEDVVATTHLLKSLKKLVDAPPGSVNVSELLIEPGRPVHRPNLRDPETARRFQQFCSVAETTLAELLDVLDQIGSGFYAEVYTVLDRQQQLVRALSIAHMARDFKVVVTNYFEVQADVVPMPISTTVPSATAAARSNSPATLAAITNSASPPILAASSLNTSKLGSSFEANSVRVQLAQTAAELLTLFRGELARVLIIEEAVALAKVARNVKAILLMDAREAEYHNFDVPDRPPLPPGAALSQGPYERMRLEAMSEMVRYSLADIEHELSDLGGRTATLQTASEIKTVVNVVRVAFAHLKAYLDQERKIAAPSPVPSPAPAPQVDSYQSPAPAAASSSVPPLRVAELPAPAAAQEPDFDAEAEERQRLDMLKRTALLVSTNVVNNVNYLIVELQSSTRTPEIILQIARIASLIRKLMEGMALPADWKALVAPPTSYVLQSDRDLQTLFTLCMSVFEEFKGFIFDIRTELQQCNDVPYAVQLSTQISGFAKVAESYFQPL